MYPRHQFGKQSEEEAAKWFLSNKTSRLLTKNYRTRWGEIDLIFEEQLPQTHQIELVFIEVRARSQKGWITGPESLGPKKQKKLLHTANHFLSRYKGPAKTTRFDLLHWNGTIWGHIPNLWL